MTCESVLLVLLIMACSLSFFLRRNTGDIDIIYAYDIDHVQQHFRWTAIELDHDFEL